MRAQAGTSSIQRTTSVIGFDSHELSIELARKETAQAGLADRADFAVARAQDFPGTGSGLVAAFDCPARHGRRPVGRGGTSARRSRTTACASSSSLSPETT